MFVNAATRGAGRGSSVCCPALLTLEEDNLQGWGLGAGTHRSPIRSSGAIGGWAALLHLHASPLECLQFSSRAWSESLHPHCSPGAVEGGRQMPHSCSLGLGQGGLLLSSGVGRSPDHSSAVPSLGLQGCFLDFRPAMAASRAEVLPVGHSFRAVGPARSCATALPPPALYTHLLSCIRCFLPAVPQQHLLPTENPDTENEGCSAAANGTPQNKDRA